MKNITIYLLSIIMGVWLVFDGIHVLATGKYFGPPEPGPWAIVVKAVGINPFALGIPFVILGVLWIISIYLLYSQQSRAVAFSSLLAIASLWYLPFGTIIAILVLVLLWVRKDKKIRGHKH